MVEMGRGVDERHATTVEKAQVEVVVCVGKVLLRQLRRQWLEQRLENRCHDLFIAGALRALEAKLTVMPEFGIGLELRGSRGMGMDAGSNHDTGDRRKGLLLGDGSGASSGSGGRGMMGRANVRAGGEMTAIELAARLAEADADAGGSIGGDKVDGNGQD